MRRPTFDTPAAAEQAFYDAMGSGDLEAMMAVWADGDDTLCVHPGGPRLVGSAAIRKSFGDIFEGGGVRIATVELRAFQHGQVAIHSLIEQIAVQGRRGSATVSVVATNVYLRSGHGWTMTLHHAATTEAADGGALPQPERPPGPLH
jgi:ketosteroid isomerase-like protein